MSFRALWQEVLHDRGFVLIRLKYFPAIIGVRNKFDELELLI